MIKINKSLLLILLVTSYANSYGMQAARRIFSNVCTATQVGIVASPFAFAAAHKAADYANPDSSIQHLQDASPETQNYVRSILATQNVANPESVHVKVSNAQHAHTIAAHDSLFARNKAITLNRETEQAIAQGIQLHQEIGGQEAFADIAFPEKAHIAAQAQQLNQYTTLQQAAALAAAPVIAHGAVKMVTATVRNAWDSLYVKAKNLTIDPVRSLWNRAYPTRYNGMITNFTPKAPTLFRSAMRLPGTPVKLTLAAAVAAALYRNIDQRATDASILTREELQSAAQFYANQPAKTLYSVNPAITEQVERAYNVLTPDQKNMLSQATDQVPADIRAQASDLFLPEVNNSARASGYWTRSQK